MVQRCKGVMPLSPPARLCTSASGRMGSSILAFMSSGGLCAPEVHMAATNSTPAVNWHSVEVRGNGYALST